MGRERTPHVGRPFDDTVSETVLNEQFQAVSNLGAISVQWPLTIQSTLGGGIRIGFDQSALSPGGVTSELIWPVIVREVRDDNDHFIMIQDVDRDDSDPWVGGMKSIGEAYEAPIWGHHVARDFRPFITRQTDLDRFVTILPAIVAIGQVWVMQYLRHDLVQPSTRVRYTDCISALTKDT